MTRALVGYATRGGTTADIAGILADELRAQGLHVDVADLKDRPAVHGYDLVVAGSAINAGVWLGEGITWLALNAEALRSVPVAVFNVCLNAADPTKAALAATYNRAATQRVSAVAETSFAGRFVPERIGWFRRTFLRTMAKPPQDHVDPDAVRGWARGVASAVVV